MDTQCHTLAVCSSPLSAERCLCWGPDAKARRLAHSYRHAARKVLGFWRLQDVGRISDLQDAIFLKPKISLWSRFFRSLVSRCRADPHPNAKSFSLKWELNDPSKYMSMAPRLRCVFTKLQHAHYMFLSWNITFWAKATRHSSAVVWGSVARRVTRREIPSVSLGQAAFGAGRPGSDSISSEQVLVTSFQKGPMHDLGLHWWQRSWRMEFRLPSRVFVTPTTASHYKEHFLHSRACQKL